MPDNDFSPLADTEVHYLHSEHVGDEFKIFIGHCGGPVTTPPAVLYVTDANGLFAGAVDMIRLMQLSAHLPSLLVVGIGYRMGALIETIEKRTRDYTPTYDPLVASRFPGQSVMGGADAFLAFIRQELQPWVQERFSVDAFDSTYFGHSLGGLFGTHVLLSEPTTFRRYGIGSPSLWWDNDIIFEHEARYAAGHDDLPAQVFFCIGEYEDHDGRQREAERLSAEERARASQRYIDMVADAERMVTSLRMREFPGLAIDSVVLPGEFHITVPQLNLSRSLRSLFDAPR
jgi:predicted alpha/beta superfamily hydrolase